MKKPRKNAVSSEELDKFEGFIFEMDDVLEAFVSEASQKGLAFDYSLQSLSALEHLLLSKPEAEEDANLVNRAARYLGEVFRKAVGGKWELCLKDPKYLYFKLPVIAGYAKMPIEFCPIEVITNFLRKREGGMLRRVVESHLEYKA